MSQIKSSDGKPSNIPRRSNEEKKSEGRNPKDETAKQMMQQIESLHREIAQIESEIAKYQRYSEKQMPNKNQVLQALTKKHLQKQDQLHQYKQRLNTLKLKGQA